MGKQLWYVRAWDAEGAFVDDGPWERWMAELVLADIGQDATVSRVRVVKAKLISEDEVLAACDPLIEPKAITGQGPQGSLLGWGRGQFTEQDEERTLFHCLVVPRREQG